MKIHKFTFNPIEENTYILYDESGRCIIVDAGCYTKGEQEELAEFIQENGLIPEKIINTHGHFDHLLGNSFCREKYHIPFYIHKDDVSMVAGAENMAEFFGISLKHVSPPDGLLKEGTKITLGKSFLEVIHLPGHSPGGVAFYNKEQNFLLSGDSLFRGGIGRTDFPGGNENNLIKAIKEKVMVLPEETIIYTGHGPETTIKIEKKTNQFLL